MIRIFVDSGSDYLPEDARSRGMEVLPLVASVEGNEYRNGIDLGRDEFYELLESTGAFPKTSQVSPHLFAEAFKEARAAGDEVVAITLSSELSGTHQSALLAQAMAGSEGIYVVDSLSATYNIALMADYACALREEGLSAKQIAAELDRFKKRVRIVASLDTLEYLQRGGRLPKAAARVGEMAKLKPVITLSSTGSITLINACLGRKKALDAIVKQVGKSEIDTSFPVYSIYSYGTKNCEKSEERLKTLGITPTERRQIGFVIGAHIGPGACGVVYVEKEQR